MGPMELADEVEGRRCDPDLGAFFSAYRSLLRSKTRAGGSIWDE
jgi:hypothetical protein